MSVNPEALFALLLDGGDGDLDQHASRIEGEMRGGCFSKATLSSDGLGATAWQHGDGSSPTWNGKEPAWLRVSAPAVPVYDVEAGAPITAATVTRLTRGAHQECLVPAAACAVLSDNVLLEDSSLTALLLTVQRLLGGDAVIADTLILSNLTRTYVENISVQKTGWPQGFGVDSWKTAGAEAFRAVLQERQNVQALHAASILKRRHVVFPFHIPGNIGDVKSVAGLKKIYRFKNMKNRPPGAQHWAFLVAVLPEGGDSTVPLEDVDPTEEVRVLVFDTMPDFTGKGVDVASAVLRELLNSVGSCFSPVKTWQSASVGFEVYPVPVQSGTTECGLMVILHLALFLMGATVEQHATFSTKAKCHVLRASDELVGRRATGRSL